MVNKNFANNTVMQTGIIDCACLIHGTGYDWKYVDTLYSMLQRNLTPEVRLHVYTEPTRAVPSHMIKHELVDWGISGPKKSWWYKLQLFNSDLFRGSMIYFDLDTVITNNIDWIWKLPLQHFWAIRDFKYLWRPHDNNINSSVMWWNTAQYDYVWKSAIEKELPVLFKKYHGDQDFISDVIHLKNRRFFNTEWVKSWRWECFDGGYNFNRRVHNQPGTGTSIDKKTSILVFHGNPKPAQIVDPLISLHWN